VTDGFRYVDPRELRARFGKPALAQEHSPTSREAAARIEPKRGTLQTLVYLAINATGTSGLTDEEGIEATGLPASTYRPRRVELVEQSRIRDSHLTRLTKSRRRAVVWVVC
jgi:hypothetical protein